MKVILLQAIYKSEYDDYPDIESLGVFSSELMVQKAICAYEARKHRFHAECLLKDTTYKRYELEVDKIKHIDSVS
jgi:hypothetical protein